MPRSAQHPVRSSKKRTKIFSEAASERAKPTTDTRDHSLIGCHRYAWNVVRTELELCSKVCGSAGVDKGGRLKDKGACSRGIDSLAFVARMCCGHSRSGCANYEGSDDNRGKVGEHREGV